ncbi:TraK domain-containing protein [Shewanella sp. SG41-4]|uniref:TraK domain-containing protein n=1 Tax=Shewanella TaxID=22 RepID=UPI001600CADF|nr:type-F conjugative transfer system secretin TraK [Shewanella sp. SG41-4]MBB1438443.1 type-F conjugative transfer system secretin TraK [Shewanella sp. SG41-4]
MKNIFKLSLVFTALLSQSVCSANESPDPVNEFSLPVQTSNQRLSSETIENKKIESPVSYIFNSLKSAVPDDKEDIPPKTDSYGRALSTTGSSSGFASTLQASYKPVQNYSLKPGENIAVAIAAGLMNRIKTNFSMVAVRTSDEESIIEASNGYIYFTTNSMNPVGIMVYEEGMPETAISLVLQPDNNPPAMVNVDVKLTGQQRYLMAERKRERDRLKKIDDLANMHQEELSTASHITRMKSLLLPIAQNGIPQGFTESVEIPQTLTKPCSVAIRQKTAQRYAGSREYIDVVVMYNHTAYAYQIKEEQCLSRDALAVAFIDQSILQPGESTEVYIVRDKLYVEKMEKTNRRRQISAQELGLIGEAN